MAFKQRSTGSPLEFKEMGSSPAKHGTNPKGDKPHTKFKTETEHEEYHDVHPTKDLNKAEIKETNKPENTALKYAEYMEMASQASSAMGEGDKKDGPKGPTEAFKTGKKSSLNITD